MSKEWKNGETNGREEPFVMPKQLKIWSFLNVFSFCFILKYLFPFLLVSRSVSSMRNPHIKFDLLICVKFSDPMNVYFRVWLKFVCEVFTVANTLSSITAKEAVRAHLNRFSGDRSSHYWMLFDKYIKIFNDCRQTKLCE